MDATKKYENVDAYIADQSEEVQKLLQELRSIIKELAPKATELISYGMPAYKQHGVLLYFAANKHHIGLYPTANPIVVFADQLTNYKTSKGAIQFPIKTGLPTQLIREILIFRMQEDEIKFEAKRAKS